MNMQDCQSELLDQEVIPNSAKHLHLIGQLASYVAPFADGYCSLTAIMQFSLVNVPESSVSVPPIPSPSWQPFFAEI